ncbi:MAG: rod shape-determining protein [Actinomycetota bacterium]|nr:rod shape-determining protein [Actinomycetota bacterium]
MSGDASGLLEMSMDLAIDVGTASIRVAEHGGMVLDEPAIAAVDVDSGRLLAFGAEALTSGAATAGRVRLVRPVRHGQLADLRLAEELLAALLRRAGATRRGRPRVLCCVHADATAVQRRAAKRALEHASARTVRFLELPLAVAIGAGVAIEEPTGSMVLEVGAATADVAVLALGGMVTSATVSQGADGFEAAARSLLARRHGLVVDQATAREILAMIGTVDPSAAEARVEVLGHDRATGRPSAAVLRRSELRRALEEHLEPVLAATLRCITESPPDLANDLLGAGLVLAGGASQLDGVAGRVAEATGIPVRPAADARRCAVLGAARCLAWLDEIQTPEDEPRWSLSR